MAILQPGRVGDTANHDHTSPRCGPPLICSNSYSSVVFGAFVRHYGQKGHLLRSAPAPISTWVQGKFILTAACHCSGSPPSNRFQLLGTAQAIDRVPQYSTGPVPACTILPPPSLSPTSTLALCRVTQTGNFDPP